MQAVAFGSPLETSIFVEGLRARPGFFVGSLLLVHAALWTAVSLISDPIPDPKLAIGVALGREWQLGYPDAPPLAPWLIEAAYRAGGTLALHAAGPLAVALAGWLVFKLARHIVGERHGALATFLMVGVHPVAFPVSPFDSDVVQMPLVALAVLAWWRAVGERSRVAWVVLGAALAALSYAGMQGLFVLAVLIVLTAAFPGGRAAFRSHDGLLAAVTGLFVFTLLITPRVIWLADHNFAGLIAGTAAGIEPAALIEIDNLISVVMLGHAGLVVLILLASPLRAHDREIAPAFVRPSPSFFARSATIALALIPGALAAAAAAYFMLRFPVEAASSLVLYSGLFAVVLAGPTIRIHRQRTAAIAAMTLLILPPVLEAGASLAWPWIGGGGRPTNWPAEAAGRYVTDVFRTRTGRPLQYVIGDARTASAVALASRDRPHVFVDADPARAIWIDQNRLKTEGAVVVWRIEGANAAPPPNLAVNLPPLVTEAPLTFRWARHGNLDLVRVGWAIIPPAR